MTINGKEVKAEELGDAEIARVLMGIAVKDNIMGDAEVSLIREAAWRINAPAVGEFEAEKAAQAEAEELRKHTRKCFGCGEKYDERKTDAKSRFFCSEECRLRHVAKSRHIIEKV